jgi:predicted Zn finger-like uncharacterized protein
VATGLATRCSACHTVFRVVPDQLRVSEGWVRCGKCAEVFNALEGLIDLETGTPQRHVGSGLAPAAPAATDAEAEFDVAHPAARPGSGKVVPEPPMPPMPAPDIVASLDDRISRFAEDFDTQANTQAQSGGDSEDPALPKPSFVRHADRAARWRRPWVRALLLLVLLAGSVLLAGQVAIEYRDLVAARWPEARPLLQAACEPLACSVGPARAIDSLAVESSGLVRVERSALYKLQVGLRNRSEIDVAVPALDLTLTDTQGRLVARKVLLLADLGVTQATIAAGRELPISATLQAQGEAASLVIAGYTIDLFYP